MRLLASLLGVVVLVGCNNDLSLPEATLGAVKGVVVEKPGLTPLGNIEVRLVTAQGARLAQRTDAAGAFAFASVSPGVHALEVRLDTYAAEVVLGVTVGRGLETDVGTIALTPLAAEAAVTGKVVVAGGGPIDGARVEFTSQATTQRVALALVGPDGVFTERVAPGTYTLRASHPLYASVTRADVNVRAGANDLSADPLSLALNPATLTGRVLRKVTTPGADPSLPQVLVTLGTGQTTTTDVMGRFQLTGLAGGPTTARLSLANFVDVERPVTLVPGEATSLGEVTLLGRVGAIEGTVELSDQQPVQDVMVSITGTTFSTLAVPDPLVQGRGSYRLENVPNGTWEVTATRTRYSRAVASGVTVTDLAPVATVAPLRLTLLVGDFRIDDGDPTNADGFTRRPDVTLQLAAFAGADDYRASEDPAFADAGWLPLVDTNRPFPLAPTEGAHVVYAQYRRQGATSPTFQSSVVLDSTGPAMESLTLNAGATYTNFGASLALELGAVDPASAMQVVSGVGGMRVSLSNATQAQDAGVFLVGTTVPWTREYTLGLQPRADGPIAVYAQFVDNAGNPSAVVGRTITLDRLEPQAPTLRIRDGAGATVSGYTNSPFVELEHSADPDGGQVLLALANSSTGLAVATFAALTPSSAWVLDPSGPDQKTVFAKFRDVAGNLTAPLQAQIIYDPNPPSPVSAAVLGATTTRDAGVTLQLSATDTHGLSPTAALTVSEDPLFQGATPGPLPGNGQYVAQLSPGDGLKQLFVRFTDRAGNHATTSVRVTLDTQAPAGSFTVGTGAPIQTGSSFTVTFGDVSADVTQMYVAALAAAPSCDTVMYGPFSPTTSLTLSDGARTIYACLRDAAGNRALLSPVSVLVDNAVPSAGALTLAGLSNPGAGLTNLFALTLQLAGISDATTGVTDVRVATDGSFAGVGFAPLNGGAVVTGSFSVPFTLPPGDGPRTVFVQVRDRAGLVSPTVQANLTLDTQPPVWSTTGVTQAFVSTATATLTLAASDAIDLQSDLRVGTALTQASCSVAPLVPFNAALPTPTLSVGANTLFLCLADRAGNRPPLPPAVSVTRLAGLPLAANLVPNPPLPLASGALVSWTDANTFIREVEIDASLDATFATGVRTWRSRQGTCGVSPPPTSARIGLDSGPKLTNLRNWYVRLRSVDCAGNASGWVPVLEPVTPNLSATVVGDTLEGAQLFVDGDRLWVHGLENATALGGRVERLRSCRASVADCRDPAAWQSLPVVLSAGAVNDSSRRASMFATDDALFLFDSVRDGTGWWSLVLASCARATDCTAASNWSRSVSPALPLYSQMSATVSGATSSTLGVFVVGINAAWGSSYLTMLRCDRSRGGQCRDLAQWSLVQTPITLDVSKGLTLAANDSQFLIGGVSVGPYGLASTGPDGANEPVLVKCEGLCIAGGNPAGFCNGGSSWPADPMPPACGCDGQTCGDFRFSRLSSPPPSTVAFSSPPWLVATGGQVSAVWAERRCAGAACSDSVRSSTCTSADCQYGTSYVPAAAPLAQWASTGTNTPLPRAKAVIGGTQEVGETVRAVYVDASDGHTWVSSCVTVAGAPCFDTATRTRISGPGETGLLELGAVGTNLYALGARALGEQVLWQPFVPSPSQFVMGPTTTGLDVSWTSWSAATQTDVEHALPDGGAPARVVLADPFVSSVSLSASTGRVAAASFTNANGVGDPARAFEATPFRAVTTAPPLTGDKSVSLSAPGPGGNDSVYASMVTSTGISLGRCSTASDCAQSANWSWNAVDTGSFTWAYVSVDYPRAFAFGSSSGVISHTTPRLFLAAASVTDGVLYLYGCLLSTAASCSTPAQFTRSSLGVNTNQVGALRTVGDRVGLVLNDATGPVVKYCDGSSSLEHNVCAGPGVTNRPLNHCFSATNWKTVSLVGGPLFATSTKVAGAPHPTWGWLALVPRDAGGLVLWSCPFSTMNSLCGAVTNDCSSIANWRASIIDTGYVANNVDLDFSVGQYHPTRSLSEQSSAVYVSWSGGLNGTWGVSQCKGAPSPHYGNAWPCVADNGSASLNARYARAWSTTSVATLPGQPMASTVRSVGGDVVAAFSTESRVYLARCSGGFDCMRRTSWNAYSPGALQLGGVSSGVLAAGSQGELYLGGAVGTTPTLFSGGRFTSR